MVINIIFFFILYKYNYMIKFLTYLNNINNFINKNSKNDN